jgi:predicted anti-sigma-YlaC factor YlaD
MRCDEAREALAAARYGGEPVAATVQAHVEACAACRVLSVRAAALETALAADVALEPRPGFDTRMFARLDELRRRRTRLSRWVLGAVGLAAMGTAAVLWVRSPGSGGSPDDLALAADLELVEDLDLLRRFDEVEAFAVLSQLDPADLEALERGEATP